MAPESDPATGRFERDPLSVRYDPAAGRFVTRVLAAWDGGRNGGWVQTTLAPLSERAFAWAVARGIDPLLIRYTGRGSGIENQNEAAFRRAVYYDRRVYLWSDGRIAALEFQWERRTAAGRVARARAHPVRSASQYASKNDPYGRRAG